jgi:hydroxymethylpyrimidine pyrophosphatase-like HAD family hydrolase
MKGQLKVNTIEQKSISPHLLPILQIFNFPPINLSTFHSVFVTARALSERAKVQEEMVAKEFHEKALLKIFIEEITEKERQRLAGQRHISCQTDVQTSHAHVQTEFVPTDVSLRTTLQELGDREPAAAIPVLGARKQ